MHTGMGSACLGGRGEAHGLAKASASLGVGHMIEAAFASSSTCITCCTAGIYGPPVQVHTVCIKETTSSIKETTSKIKTLEQEHICNDLLSVAQLPLAFLSS